MTGDDDGAREESSSATAGVMGVAGLPVPLTPLVGREQERGAVADLVQRDDIRLLTLIGPGGVGKTRLSIAVAASVGSAFEDGVVFVPLAAVRDPDLVPFAIAGALSLRDVADGPIADQVRDHFRDRTMLLVLDNVEQVTAAAPWVAQLLEECPDVTVLATSRSRLDVYGEHVFPVPTLGLPLPDLVVTASQAVTSDAIRLFAQRARAAEPTFAFTDDNAQVVATICRRVDGLPLAIELVAPQVRFFRPVTLLEQLDRRLALLTGGGRDLPSRLQSMRDAISWSYDLLRPSDQQLFRRLAVFVGGCTLESARIVIDAPPRLAALETAELAQWTAAGSSLGPMRSEDVAAVIAGLASLVDQSLLQRIPPGRDDARFTMLETIREYGLERLAAAGEADPIMRAHAAYFLDLAERAELALSGPDRAEWLGRLAAEHSNLRAALTWAIDRQEAETALRLGGALWRFWAERGHLSEGRRWLEGALALPGGPATAPRAKALHYLGNLALDLSDYRSARSAFEGSLRLRREIGDQRGVASSLTGLGLVAIDQGKYEQSRSFHEESLAIKRGLGDRRGESLSLYNLGRLAAATGDLDLARSLHNAALAIRVDLDDAAATAYSYQQLGGVARRRGDLAAAPLLERALTNFRAVGELAGEGHVLYELGRLAYDQREPSAALARLREALVLRRELGDRLGLAECLEALAPIAAGWAERERALRLWGAAAVERDRLGTPIPPVDRETHERLLTEARVALGDPAATVAWTAGGLMPTAEVIAEALSLRPPTTVVAGTPGSARPASPYGLTTREIEVLSLVAAGLPDREIAERLFLSRRTINTHVANVLNRLAVPSRSAAIARAVREGIV